MAKVDVRKGMMVFYNTSGEAYPAIVVALMGEKTVSLYVFKNVSGGPEYHPSVQMGQGDSHWNFDEDLVLVPEKIEETK